MSEPPPAVLVLVVEDEPIQRMTLVDVLEDGGFDVVSACDAETAIAILESRDDIRLLVTDIRLPRPLDGVRLAATVCDRQPPIGIVLISAGRPPAPEELPARAEFMFKPSSWTACWSGCRRWRSGARRPAAPERLSPKSRRPVEPSRRPRLDVRCRPTRQHHMASS